MGFRWSEQRNPLEQKPINNIPIPFMSAPNPPPSSGDKSRAKKYSFPLEDPVRLADLREWPPAEINKLLQRYRIDLRYEDDDDRWLHELLAVHIENGCRVVGEGTLQILPDGFGFLRSAQVDYLSGPDDIYVSPSQIRKFNLCNGDQISGSIRPPKDSERYYALLRVQGINGTPPSDTLRQVFSQLDPIPPTQKMSLNAENETATDMLDMFVPMGLGQRALMSCPSGGGKTKLLQQIVKSVAQSHSEMRIFVLLVDQNPEDGTTWNEELAGTGVEIINSTFEESAARHLDVASMIFEKSCRMVEASRDVFVIIDSLSALARIEMEKLHAKKTSPDRFDEDSEDLSLNADSIPWTRKRLALARNTAVGGSLSILATLDRDSDLDHDIADRLLPKANCRIILDPQLIQQRVWPPIDLEKSQSDFEEAIQGDALDRINPLRAAFMDADSAALMERLVSRMEDFSSNAEFLKSTNAADLQG